MLHYHIKGRRSRGPPSVRLHPPCRRGSLPNRPGGRRRHDAVGGSVRGRGRSPQTYYPAAGSSVDLAIGAGAARWADGSAGAGVPRDLLWRRPPALTWRLARAVDEAIPCGPPSVWRPPWCFSADPLQRGGLSRRSGGRRGAGVGVVGAGRVGPWAWSAPVEHLLQGDLTRGPSGGRGASIAVVVPGHVEEGVLAVVTAVCVEGVATAECVDEHL